MSAFLPIDYNDDRADGDDEKSRDPDGAGRPLSIDGNDGNADNF